MTEAELSSSTIKNLPSDKPIVEMKNISVEYRVPTERVGTFKEFAIRRIQGKVSFANFWALDNVTMAINRGEVFGLIGRNGAGKSTMLKVISRVLRPTKGRVIVYGKIAPLLELGAGFHPELSGRENIYLNGALLGHKREEMDEVFDEIVDFAEIEQFIDAPIRTYSSGMYARLGFAAATAYLPEILIVDEILSVGDEAFQEKCNDRIRNFQKQGSTIIIVSHSLEKIKKMCHRAAWLDHGKLKSIGDPEMVVEAYRAESE